MTRHFLKTLRFDNFDEKQTVPVMGGWRWECYGDGHGSLKGPDDVDYVKYDLLDGEISLNGEVNWYPKLNMGTIQEKGEKFAYNNLFDDATQSNYDKFSLLRNNELKDFERGVREQMKGLLQLERRENSWFCHVDIEGIKELSGVELFDHIVSKDEGIELFNRVAESLDVSPIRDPVGYMKLEDNMHTYIRQQYKNKYSAVLDAIDNNIVDGTGYGISHVLETMDPTIRKDVKEYLPKEIKWGDLNFIPVNDERKEAVDNFVKARISKSISREMKRSYEPETRDRMANAFKNAGDALKESLSDSPKSHGLEQ